MSDDVWVAVCVELSDLVGDLAGTNPYCVYFPTSLARRIKRSLICVSEGLEIITRRIRVGACGGQFGGATDSDDVAAIVC